MQGAYVYSPPAPLDSPFHIYAINPDLRFAFPNATTDGAVEQTFRLIVKPDLFGEGYRLRFSNFFGTQAVTLKAISVAVQDYAGNIIPGTLREVTFGRAGTVTIQPGKLVYSDGFRSPADPDDPLLKGRNFAISFAVQGKSGPMTYHNSAFTTSYISPPNSGDHTEDIHDFAFPHSTTAVFFLDALDVIASADTAVVCAFGASTTDGTASTINGNDRWSNDLSIRLHEAYGNKVSVVNEGIAGNTVVNPAFIGPAAVDRLNRDVLGLSGLTSLVWDDTKLWRTLSISKSSPRSNRIETYAVISDRYIRMADKAASRCFLSFQFLVPAGDARGNPRRFCYTWRLNDTTETLKS